MLRKVMIALSFAALAPSAALACDVHAEKADASDNSVMVAKKGKKSKKPAPPQTSLKKS